MRHTPRGKRSGRNQRRSGEVLKDIHSTLDGLPSGSRSGYAHKLKGTSATAVIEDTAKYYECSYAEETPDTHVIPRESITKRQLLGIVPQTMEFATRNAKQLDRKSGKLIETSDRRLVWKSDKTLLRRGNPFNDAENGDRSGYKREGSIHVGAESRRYTESIPNPAKIETVYGDPVIEDVTYDDLDD